LVNHVLHFCFGVGAFIAPIVIAQVVTFGGVRLLFGRISWTDRDTVVDAGPLQVQTEERERLPIPPIAGGIMLVAGIVLLIKK
jgi:hypothetical protein